MKKILFEDALILNAIRFARFCVRLLPLDVCLCMARGVGSVTYFFSKRRHIAYKNLRMVFAGQKSAAEMKRIAHASFQNLAMAGVEMLRIPELTHEDIQNHFRIRPVLQANPQALQDFTFWVLEIEFQVSDEEDFIRRCLNP